MRKNIVLTTIVFIFIFTSLFAQKQTLLKAHYFFDSETGDFKNGVEVLIRGRQIIDVGQSLSYDKTKTKVIDLGDATLLPGLIDAHTHVLIEEELHADYFGFGETVIKNVVTKSDAIRALEGAARARSYLEEGFTSIRDLGNSGLYADVDLRNAINQGLVEGSRLFVSGPGIAATGGQVNGLSFEQGKDIIHKEYQIVNGIQEAISAVRDHILMRVDLIKVYADNIPNRTTLSVDELKTVVDEAARHQKKVTAHAITNQAIWNAAQANVYSIEHAYVISDSTLQLVKEKEITLIPTYSNKELTNELFLRNGITDSIRRSSIVERGVKRQKKSLQKLYKSGVKLAFGSDFYSKTRFTRGQAAKKGLLTWLEAEIPLENVLQYATIHAAEVLNMRNRLGQLKKRYIADIIAVEGDLSKNSNALENVVFVMKDGEIIKKH